jgi:hypothetical protein
MIRKIARTLELSVAMHSKSTVSSVRQERSADIEQMRNPLERHTARRIDRSTARHPKFARIALNGIAHGLAGIGYEGNGAWSSVYRSGDEVVKVLRNTALMSDQERSDFAAKRNDMCTRAAPILGRAIVPQVYETGTHPFGDYRVVVAKQQFIAGPSLDLFVFNTMELQRAAVDAFCSSVSDGQQKLQDLAVSTFVLDDQHALVPDINGGDNLRIDRTGELRLIDAEPVSGETNPGGRDLILAQAEALSTYLDSVR